MRFGGRVSVLVLNVHEINWFLIISSIIAESYWWHVATEMNSFVTNHILWCVCMWPVDAIQITVSRVNGDQIHIRHKRQNVRKTCVHANTLAEFIAIVSVPMTQMTTTTMIGRWKQRRWRRRRQQMKHLANHTFIPHRIYLFHKRETAHSTVRVHKMLLLSIYTDTHTRRTNICVFQTSYWCRHRTFHLILVVQMQCFNVFVLFHSLLQLRHNQNTHTQASTMFTSNEKEESLCRCCRHHHHHQHHLWNLSEWLNWTESSSDVFFLFIIFYAFLAISRFSEKKKENQRTHTRMRNIGIRSLLFCCHHRTSIDFVLFMLSTLAIIHSTPFHILSVILAVHSEFSLLFLRGQRERERRGRTRRRRRQRCCSLSFVGVFFFLIFSFSLFFVLFHSNLSCLFSSDSSSRTHPFPLSLFLNL